jgi:hypothetical protein
MGKKEFIRKIEDEKPNIGEYILVLDKITDEPLVMGCSNEQGIWKVYKTKERGGHYIIKETDSENEAFNLLYDLVKSKHKRQ